MANCLFSDHNPLQEHLLIWVPICLSQSFSKIIWKVNTLVTFTVYKAEEIHEGYITFINTTTNINYRRNYDPEQIQLPHPLDFMTGIANEIVLNLASNLEVVRQMSASSRSEIASYHPFFRKCSTALMINRPSNIRTQVLLLTRTLMVQPDLARILQRFGPLTDGRHMRPAQILFMHKYLPH